MKQLLSPCHQVPLYIFHGNKEDAPIMCCSACDNEWDIDGEAIAKEVNGL